MNRWVVDEERAAEEDDDLSACLFHGEVWPKGLLAILKAVARVHCARSHQLPPVRAVEIDGYLTRALTSMRRRSSEVWTPDYNPRLSTGEAARMVETWRDILDEERVMGAGPEDPDVVRAVTVVRDRCDMLLAALRLVAE